MDEFAIGASTESSAYGATKILMIYRESPADLPGSAADGGDGRLFGRSGFRTQAVLSGSRRLLRSSRAESVVWFRFPLRPYRHGFLF